MKTMNKYVNVNKRDLRLALKEALRPMMTFFDPNHGNIPYFGNCMTGENWGNAHSTTFSMAHIPGRWLNGLLNAEDVLGKENAALNEEAVQTLGRWARYSISASKLGFPPCIDEDTTKPILKTDLHNLREVMHALTALVQFRGDEEARTCGMQLIDAVDRYFDYASGQFREELWRQETGGSLFKWGALHADEITFPVTFGRYIGPLVKFYKATGEVRALQQAISLKDVCFRDVLNEKGDYDVRIHGSHTHSTTAMISSLAILGDVLRDRTILDRCRAFVENGLNQIAVDFGWCIENYARQDDVGEINNTADILETCLILGKWGCPGYYARAERILRAHLLPSQLLDTHFIEDPDDENCPARYRMASRSKGAFGFPCPYGHEDHEGARVSFNWDIVGGGSEGLCEAIRGQCTLKGALYSVNLLFDTDNAAFTFRNPYDGNGVAEINMHQPVKALRIRMPGNCKGVTVENAESYINGEWLYLCGMEAGGTVRIFYDFEDRVVATPFRGKFYTLRWHGEEVTGAVSRGKRLCFFPEIEAVV